MKRFIRYLYEYEQGKRIRNVGFVKVEAGDEETIVHMQGKGFHNSDDRKLVLYLFYEENGNVVRIRQNEMNLTTPVLNCHFSYAANGGEVVENYSKINGVLVETESGRRIAATWDDRPVNVGPEVQKDSEVDSESKAPGRKVTKIQRKDISRLPRCEWKLANNRFLMHGHNNYHHLVLIEDGNVLKIGVPGIYHIKEAEYADVFGFGEFISAVELEITLESDEMQPDEMFGYWCRIVNRHQLQR